MGHVGVGGESCLGSRAGVIADDFFMSLAMFRDDLYLTSQDHLHQNRLEKCVPLKCISVFLSEVSAKALARQILNPNNFHWPRIGFNK